MNDLIKIKGGAGIMPMLQDRELGYHKTEKALYIGTPAGNVKLCNADDIQKLIDLAEKPEPAGIFYAIYGETTGEEISTAYKAGKAIACKITIGDHNGRIMQLVTDWLSPEENGFTFACFDYPRAFSAEVSGSYWTDITVRNLTPTEEPQT